MRKAESRELHVDEDIAKAESLPAEAFTAGEILQRELKTLFPRSWLLLAPPESGGAPRPLPEQVKLRGSRLPLTVLDRPLFLQRGWQDNRLRLFPNVCTHAWYPLVSGASRSRAIVCGQHGRQFDCAGRFLSQPGFGKGTPNFPRDCDHLQALPVESLGPLSFACLGEPPAPFASYIKEVKASLPPLDGLEALAGSWREVDGNWKQHAWNYMDRFHITFIHRAPGGLADAIDLDTYKTELYPFTSLQWAYAKDPKHGFDPELLPARFRDPGGRRVFALWWFLFPNLTLNFYPWGLSVNLYEPASGDPQRTRFFWQTFRLDKKKYDRRNEDWLLEQVDAEDVEAMRDVRRGAASGLAPRGRFSPQEEKGPHWFHRLVSRALLDGAPSGPSRG